MKIFIYCLLVIFLYLTACNKNDNSKKYYSSNGSLREERIYKYKGDTTFFLFINYFDNGRLLSKGYIKNREKTGSWQEWYMDGTLKWSGEYVKNRRGIKIPVDTLKIIMADSSLRQNKPSFLRVKASGIHPNDIIIACNNGIIKNAPNKGLYDFVVTPKRLGKIKFFLFVDLNGKMTPIGKDSLIVKN